MDTAKLQELLSQPVASITGQLPDLDRESLVELQAMEVAGNKRGTLLTAIDKALLAIDSEGGDDKNKTTGAEESDAAVDAAAITSDDYRHPDYAGGLTGEQAAWRLANIKPVDGAVTK